MLKIIVSGRMIRIERVFCNTFLENILISEFMTHEKYKIYNMQDKTLVIFMFGNANYYFTKICQNLLRPCYTRMRSHRVITAL